MEIVSILFVLVCLFNVCISLPTYTTNDATNIMPKTTTVKNKEIILDLSPPMNYTHRHYKTITLHPFVDVPEHDRPQIGNIRLEGSPVFGDRVVYEQNVEVRVPETDDSDEDRPIHGYKDKIEFYDELPQGYSTEHPTTRIFGKSYLRARPFPFRYAMNQKTYKRQTPRFFN